MLCASPPLLLFAAMLFDLRSLPDEKTKPRLYLLQLPYRAKTIRIDSVEVPVTLAAIEGDLIDLLRPMLEKVLGPGKSEEFLRTDRSFVVKEDLGLQLLVGMLTLAGSRKSERLAKAIPAILRLDTADAEYWYPKLRAANELSPDKAERVRASFFSILEMD